MFPRDTIDDLLTIQVPRPSYVGPRKPRIETDHSGVWFLRRVSDKVRQCVRVEGMLSSV
jgi:hypothetical protein